MIIEESILKKHLKRKKEQETRQLVYVSKNKKCWMNFMHYLEDFSQCRKIYLNKKNLKKDHKKKLIYQFGQIKYNFNFSSK